MVGEQVRARFGGLPFLFKVLAAAKPLSLQAHPSKEQAERGFAREDDLGIDRLAPNRNYRDSNHKPELICALSPFFALCGFRSAADATSLLAELSSLGLAREVTWFFEPFLRSPSGEGRRQLLERGFALDRQELSSVLSKTVDVLRGVSASGKSDSSTTLMQFSPWFQKLVAHYPDDPGVMMSLLMNFLQLSKGEALFLPAGHLHAYLDGLGLEVMANSDNVLRGGMTPKHVDVPELCRVLKFESFVPSPTTGRHTDEGGGERVSYDVPVPEFSLQVLTPKEEVMHIAGPSIGIVVEGSVRVDEHEVALGQQVFVSHGVPASVSGDGRIAFATVPFTSQD
jgi:mannose-6-phosphate isomerase